MMKLSVKFILLLWSFYSLPTLASYQNYLSSLYPKLYLKCYGINNTTSQIEWNWGVDDSNNFPISFEGKINKSTLIIEEGHFELYKNICLKTFKKKDSVSLTFHKLVAASYFWSWEYHVQFQRDFNNTKIKKFIVFGDSLSDTGNLYKKSLHHFPRPPYWNGRYSDGPIWPERLSSALNIPLENWSYGGSLTSHPTDFSAAVSYRAKLLRRFLIPTGKDLVDKYISNEEDFTNNTYIFFQGPVNYLTMANIPSLDSKFKEGERNFIDNYTKSVVQDIIDMIKKLIDKKANDFLVFNLPQMNNFPNDDPHYPISLDFVKEISKSHNKNFSLMITILKDQYPHINLEIVDINSIFKKILKDTIDSATSQYGFKESANSCFQGGWYGNREEYPICQYPEHYIFFDPYHPSTKAHSVLSYELYKQLLARKGFKKVYKSHSNWQSFYNQK